MDVIAFGRTHPGHVRDHNEDAFLIDPSLGLYVVCDGMGGHEGGEIASAEAIRALRADLEQDGETDLEVLVERSINAANTAVYEMSRSADGKPGMGCTLSMVLVRGDQAVVGHAGDSRVYLKHQGEISQVTRDHTWVQIQLEAGNLTEEEIRGHPKEHVLLNAIGIHVDLEVDVSRRSLSPGDRYLICSDGLCNYVSGVSPLDYYLEDDTSAEDAANGLVHWVLQGEAHDNTTVVVVDAPPATEARSSEEHAVSWPTLNLDELEELKRVSFSAGDILVSAGSEADTWYVVVEGGLEVRRWGERVRELGPGHSVGADALLAPRPSRGDLRAMSDGTALVLPAADLENLSAKERSKILTALARHLAETARQVGWADV